MRRAFLAHALLGDGDRKGARAMLTRARADLAASPIGDGFPFIAALEAALSGNGHEATGIQHVGVLKEAT
jgi:hypothetical protein